ncbi:MAG: flagellar motor switch protein FliN [Candidatus Melainabacteria bacterium]
MTTDDQDQLLRQEEKDTLAELTNIAMGAGVATLAARMGTGIEIGTPNVFSGDTLETAVSQLGAGDKTLLIVHYKEGLSRSTVYLIKTEEARKLATISLTAMGAAPETIPTGPLSDDEREIFADCMTQLLNSAATSLASVLSHPIVIDNPEVIDFAPLALTGILPEYANSAIACMGVDITVGGTDTLQLTQLLPINHARTMVTKLVAESDPAIAAEQAKATAGSASAGGEGFEMAGLPKGSGGDQFVGGGGTINKPAGGSGGSMEVNPVTVSPVSFSAFDDQQQVFGEENKNLELVLDVSLSLAVELGKTILPIKEVLELTRGSVIELDRIAGEPVDLLANGKLIAKGEVVVIEDNFGLRITSIVSPADRIRGL